MNMKQQQQQQQPIFAHQQQQQGLTQAQNRIQQQAQIQMNNLRQQAAVAQQQQLLPQGQGPAAVAAATVASASTANPNSGSPGTPNGQGMSQGRPRPMPLQNMGGMQAPFQGNMANGAAMSPPFVTSNVPGNAHNMPMNNVSMAQGAQPGPGRNSNALQDYQMQLMVLERQNKKRLDIARSNGTSESPVSMLQLQHPLQMSPHQQLSAPPIPSPQLASQASPGASSAKPKKEPAAKRGRKPSGPNSAITPQSAGTDVGSVPNGRSATGGLLKRERNAPLTPAAESEGTKKKKKLAGGESPKKASKAAAKKEKATPKTKHAEEPKADADGATDPAFSNDSDANKMPPPNGGFFQPSLGSVEIIGGPGANGEVNFFNPGGNSSIDDIDFDFNLFLDGGDDGLNDGLSGFNWGNPIEGD